MAGHSHSSNIQRTKSAKDLKRVKAFTKVARGIVNAVKLGGGADPKLNFMLRSALAEAKDLNLPKDKVEKAIRKGQGVNDEKEMYQSKIYEVLDSNQNYLLIEAETDNSARTVGSLRTFLFKRGFKLLEPGSAMEFFRRVGEITLEFDEGSEDVFLNKLDRLIILDGIIDYSVVCSTLTLMVEKDKITRIVNGIVELGIFSIKSSRVIYRRIGTRERTPDQINELTLITDDLLGIEDIVEVWW